LRKDGETTDGVGISGGTGEEDEALAVATIQDTGYDTEFSVFNRIAR
jgi:uncharacterized protein GlcG (DUF336 family)